MLTIKKSITVTGSSKIDNVMAESFSATIDTDNLNAATIVQREVNVELCKSNKEECQADEEAFKEAVYEIIDDLDCSESKEENVNVEETNE